MPVYGLCLASIVVLADDWPCLCNQDLNKACKWILNPVVTRFHVTYTLMLLKNCTIISKVERWQDVHATLFHIQCKYMLTRSSQASKMNHKRKSFICIYYPWTIFQIFWTCYIHTIYMCEEQTKTDVIYLKYSRAVIFKCQHKCKWHLRVVPHTKLSCGFRRQM